MYCLIQISVLLTVNDLVKNWCHSINWWPTTPYCPYRQHEPDISSALHHFDMLIWLTRSILLNTVSLHNVTKALREELGASAECQAVQVDYLDCNKEMLSVFVCWFLLSFFFYCSAFVKSSYTFKRDGHHYSTWFTWMFMCTLNTLWSLLRSSVHIE